MRFPQPAHSRGPPTPDAVLAAEATADDAAVGPAPCTDTAVRPLGVCWSPAPWSVTNKRPQLKTLVTVGPTCHFISVSRFRGDQMLN